MKRFSLIVSTYNRADALELVLKSVMQQKLDNVVTANDIEILVADDGSTADTRKLIAQFQSSFPFKLLHIWHEDNGFRLSAIRNLAVSHSSGEYLVFIDGDCLIAPDFIVNQLKLAERGFFVGGNRVLLSEKRTHHILAHKDISISSANIWSNFCSWLSKNTNKPFPRLPLGLNASWRKKNSYNWRRPKGCNMALWRSDYYKVNGFDESFLGWGHEDADFLVRLLHAGVLIKDGRFAVPVFHLWHKMNDRSNTDNNIKLLNYRVLDVNLVRAVDGADKYLMF